MESKVKPLAKLLSGEGRKTVVPPVLHEVGKLAASVASVSTSSGSATGNPRNKCILKPGHSLMDWIRLTNSGRDLTGVGNSAGKLKVTHDELAKHNTEKDAWIAIEGKVFNVTDYLYFHPGGVDRLMEGVGKDGTRLFQDVHPWVNYQQMLQKCFVGVLVAGSNCSDTERPSKESPKPDGERAASTFDFSWLQKSNHVLLHFHTGPYENPYVEIRQPENDSRTASINVHVADKVHEYMVKFEGDVRSPPVHRLNYETGKLEVEFAKASRGVWSTFGKLEARLSEPKGGQPESLEHVVTFTKNVASNCTYLEVVRSGRVVHNVPLGKHVFISDGLGHQRPYTPTPSIHQLANGPENKTHGHLSFLVKSYPNGTMSKYITSRQVGETILISKPTGSFDLKLVVDASYFVFTAAGTGITPILQLLLFALERTVKPTVGVSLLLFNRHEQDMIFRDELTSLEQKYKDKLKIRWILSKPPPEWTGPSGRISKDIVRTAVEEDVPEWIDQKTELFFMTCGPPGFTKSSVDIIVDELRYPSRQVHAFAG